MKQALGSIIKPSCIKVTQETNIQDGFSYNEDNFSTDAEILLEFYYH
jgi:hypothetical protein